MSPIQNHAARSARPKVLFTLAAMIVFCIVANSAFSQPPGPPPPPPPPGELIKKINPFKKHKDTTNKKDTSKVKPGQTAAPAGPPPPPPSPLDIFKKKKKDTTKKTQPGTGN